MLELSIADVDVGHETFFQTTLTRVFTRESVSRAWRAPPSHHHHAASARARASRVGKMAVAMSVDYGPANAAATPGDGDRAELGAAEAAGAVFAILNCLLQQTPLPGRAGEPATASAAADAVAALGCASGAVVSGLWAAHGARGKNVPPEGAAAFSECVRALTAPRASAGGAGVALLEKEDALVAMGPEAYEEVLGAAGSNAAKLEKTLRTRYFYTISSFNLFREANEGYAKLLCLLGDGKALNDMEEDAAFARAVVDQIHALMGHFSLDIGKVCEIALAACCARVCSTQGPCRLPPLFSTLLDAFEPDCVAIMTGQLLALNYPPVAAAPDAENDSAAGRTPGADARSGAVLQLVATLLTERRVKLEDVWSDLYPTNAELREKEAAHHIKLQALSINKSSLLPPSNPLPSRAAPFRRGPSDRDMFTAHEVCEDGPYAGMHGGELQKVALVELLVMHGRCYDVLAMVQALSGDKLGAVDLAAHPPIAKALCGILRIVLGPAVLLARDEMRLEGMETLDPEGDAQRRSEAADLAKLGGLMSGFLEPIPTRNALLDDTDERSRVVVALLELLGPHARRSPELAQDLCLLLDVPAARDNAMAEAIVQLSLLPTLVLTQSHCVLAAKIWAVISPWRHEKRWRLYRYLEEDLPALYPITKLFGDRAAHEFKQNMKRMTVENAESLSCVVASLSHSQPVPVINALMQHLCAYPVDDSIILGMVSFCGSNSDLTNDVTIYMFLHRMADSDRKRIKDDGLNATQWFSNSSEFLSVFIRRVSPLVEGERLQINGVVHFLMKEIGVKRNVMASVMLSDILGGVAGVPTISILSERQVLAQAGGPALIDATSGAFATVGLDTSPSGKLLNTRLSMDVAAAVVSLRDAFLSTGMSADLGIAIGKLASQNLADKNFHLKQLKAVSYLKDRMGLLLSQYAAFLSLPVSDADSGDVTTTLGDDLLAIGIAPLVMEFKLQLDTAFVLLRPIVDYLQIFPSASEDPSGDVAMATADENGPSKMILPVSDIVKQFDVARKPEDTQLLSTELELSFWSLSDGDLHVPSEAYDTEIKRLGLSIRAWEAALGAERKPRHNAEMSQRSRTLEAELLKMKDIVKALEAEKITRTRRQKTVSARLALRKEMFAPSGSKGDRDVAFMRSSVLFFLQHCILPRCSISGVDAAFCGRFPVKVMTMGMQVFDMAVYFELLLEALPNKILSSSETEAEHVSALLRDTLETLDRWRLHKGTIPGVGFLSAKKPADATKQVPMDRREYLDWLRNRHERLAKSFAHVVKFQPEYLMLRNTLGALTRVIEVFPSINEHWSLLSDCVGKLQTHSKLEDIKLYAKMLTARLGKRKTHVLPDHVFRMNVSDKSSATKAVLPSKSLPPPPPPPGRRGDRDNLPTDATRNVSGKRPRSPMPGDQVQASQSKSLKRTDEHGPPSRAPPVDAMPVDSGPRAPIVKSDSGDRGSAGSPRDRDGKTSRDQGRDMRPRPRKDRPRDESGRGGRRDKRDRHGDGDDGRDRNQEVQRDRSERTRDRGSGRDRPRTADRDRDRDADHPRDHRETARDRDRERARDIASRPRGFDAASRAGPNRINNGGHFHNEYRGFSSKQSPREDPPAHNPAASAGNFRGRGGRGGGSANAGAGMARGVWKTADNDLRDSRQQSQSHHGGPPHDMPRNADNVYNPRQLQPPTDGRRDGAQPGPRRSPPGEMGSHGGGGNFGREGMAPRDRPVDSHHEGSRDYEGGRGGGRGNMQGSGRHPQKHRPHTRR